MLIIPLAGKLSRHNLPLVTITIILLNAALYFTIQWDDRNYYNESQKIYFQSGLADIEIDYYISYRQGKGKSALPDADISRDQMKHKYLREMMQDRIFQSQLTANKIIRPEDPLFEKWRELRDQYDLALGRISTWKYGFIPEKHHPATMLSYMFLHASLLHLLGNMIFLWFVGCVLELGLGRINYIILYLLGGICAVGFFYVFNMKSDVPLVGASGAVAGLMGAYTVAYGKTKINVFYSLGFYFNYTKMYAIVLLPLWIGYEALQLIFLKDSHVAYLAHIGGLASGAILGYASIRLFRKEEHKIFEEDPKEKIKPMLEEALQKMEILDMPGARRVLTDILKIETSNEDALKYLYHIDKLHPHTAEFHQTAARWLSALCRRPGCEKILTETFTDYYRLAGKPKLNSDLLLNIANAFEKIGKIEEAEALIGYVISVSPNHPRITGIMMDLAKTCHQKGRHDLRDRLVKIIVDHYPQSHEAGMLKNGRLNSHIIP